MAKILIKNGLLINRGQSSYQDLLIVDNRIEKIAPKIDAIVDKEINAEGKWIMPGIIDDQVHFRQPGLTHKGTIYTESRAALAGGVTSFMEMPNTTPPAITQERLEAKYTTAAGSAITNYSFYIGASNENIDQVLLTNPDNVCGIKIFMGSSTGNMLVDNHTVLENIFSRAHMLIATHCEDEDTIKNNLLKYRSTVSELTASHHPLIRSREGCYISSSFASNLAKKHGTRLHILHISTKEELALFDNSIPLSDKQITSEACVHHMFFDSEDYKTLGNKIKCNPAIKDASDREAIFNAVLDDRIDVIATDHAPHTLDEKEGPYLNAPSGLPLIQHTLLIMLKYYHEGKISKEKIVEKMCHAPADLFRVRDRGYLDEGKYADIVIVNPEQEKVVEKKDLLYKCKWSPLEGYTFKGVVEQVYVNGIRKYHKGNIVEQSPGMRLLFDKR
jgi:dihydroorotase